MAIDVEEVEEEETGALGIEIIDVHELTLSSVRNGVME
jgi:hypothetical protein